MDDLYFSANHRAVSRMAAGETHVAGTHLDSTASDFRVIAEFLDPGFAYIMAVCCDRVIPADMKIHPTIKVLLNAH